jgi:hypothetical protein
MTHLRGSGNTLAIYQAHHRNLKRRAVRGEDRTTSVLIPVVLNVWFQDLSGTTGAHSRERGVSSPERRGYNDGWGLGKPS